VSTAGGGAAAERRRKLRARYCAGALEQLAQLRPTVAALTAGTADVDARRTLGRALHTLKGDASLVGLVEISQALHVAEDRVSEGAWAAVADALAVTTRELERLATEGAAADGTAAAAGPGSSPARGRPGAAAAGPTAPDDLRGADPRTGSPAAGEPDRAAGAGAIGAGARAEGGREPDVSAGRDGGAAATGADAGRAAPLPGGPAIEPAARQRWVRLQTAVLDDLADRMLELATAHGRLTAGLARAVRGATPDALRSLAEEAESTHRQLEDAVGAAWALRLAPVEEALRRLADHAQELAISQGKQLRVVVDGGRAELERTTLDAIEQPLVHLIRNAVDHGVEEPAARGDKPPEATLILDARTVGGSVEIGVADDGRGIDPAVVRSAAISRGLLRADEAAALTEEAVFDLLFLFGFSTRQQATALSGRGVGLDAVRSRVEGLGGAVRLSSEPGRGARFVVAVPAAIARERVVVVEVAGGLFALPSRAVTALIRVGDFPRSDVAGGLAIRHGEGWAPLRRLDMVLGLAGDGGGAVAPISDDTPALVIDAQGRRHVFAVERVEGDRDLLRRPADALVGHGGTITASSVLDDGRVALWPSVPALVRGVRGRVRRPAAAAAARRTRRVLVVDDSPVVRDLVASILRTAGLVADTAIDGEAAWLEIDRAPPDLILSDVEMPRLDGFELLRRVRERWPHLPVVMLTTRGSEQDRRRAVSLGANAYLVKAEFEEGRLVAAVNRLIGDPT
jgi:chemotaxis protein histidine kinase CheA